MSDQEDPQEPIEVEAEVVNDPSEKTADQPKAAEPPRAQWQYKTKFGIVDEMQRVIQLTANACEAEVKVLRRKLERLQRRGAK